jgi:hypothetical protein
LSVYGPEERLDVLSENRPIDPAGGDSAGPQFLFGRLGHAFANDSVSG